RCIQNVDQPAEAPVKSGIDGTGNAANEEKQEKGTFRPPRKEKAEPGSVPRENRAVGVTKRIDGLFRPAPETLTPPCPLFIHFHSAASDSPVDAGASTSMKPPDWRCHSRA